MENKEMKALNCLLSIIDCYMKEDEKYGIFPEDTIKKDVEEAKTILETFIKKELEILEILKPRIYIEEGLYHEVFQDDRLKFSKDFFDSTEQENTIRKWLDEK